MIGRKSRDTIGWIPYWCYSICNFSYMFSVEIQNPNDTSYQKIIFFRMKILGPKCSGCCLCVAVWGVIMFILMGVFFQIKSPALRDDISPGEYEVYLKMAQNCCDRDRVTWLDMHSNFKMAQIFFHFVLGSVRTRLNDSLLNYMGEYMDHP